MWLCRTNNRHYRHRQREIKRGRLATHIWNAVVDFFNRRRQSLPSCVILWSTILKLLVYSRGERRCAKYDGLPLPLLMENHCDRKGKTFAGKRDNVLGNVR